MGGWLSALFAAPGIPAPPEPPDSWQGQRAHSLPRTDLHLCLANSAVDALTGLPLGLCSLALRYLLPEHELERYLYCLNANAERCYGTQGPLLLTGSSAEGLSVPTFCHRTVTPVESNRVVCDAPLSLPSPVTPPGERPEGPIVTASDTDCMIEIGGFFSVSPERGSSRLYMDARGASHCGYVRVLWDPDWSPPPDSEPAQDPYQLLLRPLPPSDESDSSAAGSEAALCLSSDALMQMWHENVPFTGSVERHGPSINSVNLLHGLPIDLDSVPALPLTQTPPALRAWLRRLGERRAQWPTEDVRVNIATSAGGHLVATGHASSARRDLEWRLSFSVAEKRLARTLTIAQRKVYLLVKLIQKCFLARPKVLVTYHLKTLMFWELETTRHSWSEEHLFGRVLGLLDRIDTCLAEHRLPSYFLPENNLISDCSAADVAAVRQALGQVRRDPLRSLFAIDFTVRFEFSATSPLLKFHAPLLEAITAGTSSSAAAAVAAAGLVRQARDGLVWDQHALARASELLLDAFQLRQPAGAAMPRRDDWFLMTAAALCAATHHDEDVWVRDVLRTRVAAAEDAPPMTERHVRLWEAVCPSGVPLGEESPFLALIRSCLDEYEDEVDRHTVEEIFADFIASDRPRLPSEGKATLMSAEVALEEVGDVPQTATDFSQAGVDGGQTESVILTASTTLCNSSTGQRWNEIQRREAGHEICSVLHRLVMDGFEIEETNNKTVSRKLIEAGIPKTLAIRACSFSSDGLFSLKLAGWDEFGSAKDDGGGYINQVVHRFKLIDSLEEGRQEYFDPDTYAEHVNVTSTALLDTLGHLLLNSHYTLASRTSSWLSRLVKTPRNYGDSEARRVAYNLRRAARFLACLPEAVRSLLLLSSGEVSLPVLAMLLMHSAPLLEETAAALDAEGPPEDRVADLLTLWDTIVWWVEPPGLPDAVLLSDAVVKLCLVKLAGGSVLQCADCLTEVEQQFGSDATKHIRRALAEP